MITLVQLEKNKTNTQSLIYSSNWDTDELKCNELNFFSSPSNEMRVQTMQILLSRCSLWLASLVLRWILKAATLQWTNEHRVHSYDIKPPTCIPYCWNMNVKLAASETTPRTQLSSFYHHFFFVHLCYMMPIELATPCQKWYLHEAIVPRRFQTGLLACEGIPLLETLSYAVVTLTSSILTYLPPAL